MEKYRKIQKKSPAYGIIINNQSYGGEGDREGAEKDVEKLQLLKGLNISIEHVLTDFTAQEIIEALRFLATKKADDISSKENGIGALKLLNFSKDDIEEYKEIAEIKVALKTALKSALKYGKLHNFAEYSCLMVFISTHGSKDDELVCLEGSTTTVEELSEIFNGENCKDLQGMPKMFFVQACRGEGLMVADQPSNEEEKEKKVVKTKCKFLYIPIHKCFTC